MGGRRGFQILNYDCIHFCLFCFPLDHILWHEIIKNYLSIIFSPDTFNIIENFFSFFLQPTNTSSHVYMSLLC